MTSDPLITLLRESWPESMPCAPYLGPSPEQLEAVSEQLRLVGAGLRLPNYTPAQRRALADRRGPRLHRRLMLSQRLLGTWSGADAGAVMLPLLRDVSGRERRHRRLWAEARLLRWGAEDALVLLAVALDLISDRVLACPVGPRARAGRLPPQRPVEARPPRASRPGFWQRELERVMRLPDERLCESAEELRDLRLRLSVPFLRPRQRLELHTRATPGQRQLSWSTARTRAYFGEITRASGVSASMMTFLIDRWRAMDALWRAAQQTQAALLDSWLLVGALGRYMHDEVVGWIEESRRDPMLPRRHRAQLSAHFDGLRDQDLDQGMSFPALDAGMALH